MNDKITAELRVKSCVVSEFPKLPRNTAIRYSHEKTDEVWEIKAEGVWTPERPYPISLHFTTYPGHPVVPSIGKVRITIESIS